MASDRIALLCLGIAVVVLIGTALARRTSLPDPVVLVAVGLAASFLPGLPDVQLPPDVVFLVFLPPLLFRASFLTSPRTLREHATPIALLAVGLVGTTALTVAWVVSALVPGIGFAEGLVLGAVVAPTDPVAAATVFQRLGAPRRVVDLVESESLVNDATALVLYALAVEAVVGDPPTVGATLLQLGWSVLGGLAIGLAVGAVVLWARKRMTDVGLQLLLSLLTPYAAYVLTDHVHSSGVLAVVTAGVLLGAGGHGPFGGPQVRLQSTALWSLLDLLLNAVLFVLLGLQVRAVVAAAPDVGIGDLLLYGAVVVAVVTGLRVAWQFVVPPVVYQVRTLAGRRQARSSPLERLLIGWTGMRGAISLAAALALPLEVEGRSLLVFLTVVVILVTLVLQGLTLPFLLRRVDVEAEQEELAEAEREARLALADVALTRLDALEEQGLPAGTGDPLRQVWQDARARLTDEADSPEVDLAELRLDIADAQRAELARRSPALPPEVVRELEHELDLQHVRLAGRDDEDRRAPVT